MTNGEKIKVLLKPRTDQIRIYGDWVEIEIQSLAINFSCDLNWWNAEYKEPTTKNDLGVDCVSRQFMHDLGATCIATRNGNGKLTALGAIEELPSVTPQEPRKGHWKLVQRGKNIDICCSNCKAVRIKECAYNYTIDQLPKEDIKECFEFADMSYCPYCGSDNREVEK